MCMSRVFATMLALLLVASVTVAVEESGTTELQPDTCPDLSDLSPSELERVAVPLFCQVIDDNGPVPQGNEAASSSLGLQQIGLRILDGISTMGLLVPTIGV
jgi:hypothetical protein